MASPHGARLHPGYLERYRPIVDDWDAFCDALRRPLPVCLWTNTLRTTADRLAAQLRADGLAPEPLAWRPTAFRLPPGTPMGHHLAFRTGRCHLQEEAALLPVVLLAPRPGERILDLCAAPGNKTACIAVEMEDRGTVVANDRSAGRSRAIGGILDHLGVACACTTTADAANYPTASGLFDRVLADVPCTCEGTSRKHRALALPVAPSDRPTGMQRAILRKAVQRCRPGGRIVYATCTYAPEENEAIVDAVLREYGDDRLRLLPARLPGFTSAAGLTEWEGVPFHPSMQWALRVWPHHHDTGGFFVAVLEKAGEGPPQPDAPRADADAAGGDAPWIEPLCRAFGFPPSLFERYRAVQPSRKLVSLVPVEHRPPDAPAPDAVGLPLLRTDGRVPKLTTAAALAFGHAATRNVVAVTRAEADAYVARRSFAVPASRAAGCDAGPFVILRCDGDPVGVARLHRTPEGALVESLFPRAWATDA